MTPEETFKHIPSFTTPRLLLRPLDGGDVDAIFSIKGDSRVTDPYGTEPHASVEVTKRWVEARLADHRNGDSITWVIATKDGGAVIGDCCYWHFDRTSMVAEIGYELHPDHWGKGTMSEALPPVLRFGFEGLGLHRIEACPLAENAPSKNLLLGLGFKYEGALRDRVLFKGRFVGQHYYGLLRGDASP